MSVPCVVWRLLDGKAGHERQTAGLVQALARLRETSVHEFLTAELPLPLWQWWRKNFPKPPLVPPPSLIVGAGRACQLPLLAARRTWGGRAVYCMKPVLPTRWFDLCLIPAHDLPPRAAHIEVTAGVLNDLAPPVAGERTRTLVLVGGPSRHHAWDEKGLLQQVASLVFGSKTRDIVIADSRRTPATTSAKLSDFVRDGVEFKRHTDVSSDWLRDALYHARAAWISADSMSMLFEALTAGAGVGVLAVPARQSDRITRVADSLIAEGKAVSLQAWLSGVEPQALATPLAEAARCARLIAERWL